MTIYGSVMRKTIIINQRQEFSAEEKITIAGLTTTLSRSFALIDVYKKKIKNRRYTVKNDENKNNNITTTIFRARRWRRRNEPDTREQRTETGWHRAVDLAGAA